MTKEQKLNTVQFGAVLVAIVLYTLDFFYPRIYLEGTATAIFWVWLGSELTTWYLKK